VRKLHPATVIVALIPALKEAVRTSLPLLIGAFISGHQGGGDWVAGLIAFLTASIAVGAYWTTRFEIAADQIIHRTGWIFRKERRIPLQQIQNINIRQNVLERMLKVATVDVETAMGHGRDLKLSVLGFDEAERIREELLGAAHIAPLGSNSVDLPIARLTNHDLFLGAVTENHLLQVITALFTVGGPGIGLIMRFASKLPPAVQPLAFCLAMALLLVGGWIWGAGTYFLKYGGFVVHKSETTFRISYGLLNKVQLAIRPKRIEFVHITVTLIQRWMSRASLYVGTAASFGEAGVYAPVGLFVEREVAYAGAQEVIPGLELHRLEWKPFHPVFYRARAIRTLSFIAGILSLGYLVSQVAGLGAALPVWLALYLLVGILLLQLAALFLAMAENGYAITDSAFVVRRGYYHQSISAMPILRMETMWMTKPFWWQRYHAANLTIQAMKQKIAVGAIAESDIDLLMARWKELTDSQQSKAIYEIAPLEANLTPPEDQPAEDLEIV
jgi:putative membrane protein